MGVSRLYTSLRPFSRVDILDGDVVTIDGPALAYHVLHLCRANNVNLPSYCFLGRVAISWLDKLVLNDIRVRSIYFDGYLPEPKLEVRISRMKNLTAQLSNLHGSTMHGCPATYIVQDSKESDINLFNICVKSPKKMIDPCFLVPAIVDALRRHKTYKTVTQLVPGEADWFCAQDICKQGGTVLTSDSDLLVHDLGHGRVAFLRDLREDNMSRITFASFVPEKIFQSIGLGYPEKALQLAYERQLSPHAAFSQIVLKSSSPLPQSAAYLNFQKQFTSLDPSNIFEKDGCEMSSLSSADPRISEMVMNFCLLRKGRPAHLPIRMFLPPLMECPVLKSAWDPSTHIRQLAYSLLSHSIAPGDGLSVHEFRRVSTLASTGREIRPLSYSLAKDRMGEVVSYSTKLKRFYSPGDHRFWIALGIALEVSKSQRQDTAALFLTIYERLQHVKPTSVCTHVAWADIHVYAQVQGILYSFRILQQVLKFLGIQSMEQDVIETGEIRAIISQLAPVAHFPDFNATLGAVEELCQSGILERITDTNVTVQVVESQNGHNISSKETETLDDEYSLVNGVVSDSRTLHSNNKFSSLIID